MLRKVARRVGLLAAAVPILGLLVSYCLGCALEGTPFSANPWQYVPSSLSAIPAGFLFVPFWFFQPQISSRGVAIHVFWPVMTAVYSVTNYYLGFYLIVVGAALIRRGREKYRRGREKS